MKVFARSIVALSALAFLFAGGLAQAQPKNQQNGKGPPNALQGFSQNRDEPVNIESNTLEVRDKDKVATFSGDVRVKQGDTAMRSQKLVVFYEQEGQGGDNGGAKEATKGAAKGATGKPMQAATPGPNGSQKIKRLEARGDVVVTQKDQTATGETGIFDMPTNTVTLTGNVVMTQGKNVLRGDKLIVDLTSGVSRVESGKNGRGRVQGLFLPSSGPETPAAAAPPKPAQNAPRGATSPGPRN